MKNGQEYMDSLRQLHPKVYAFGEEIESVVDSPLTRPHVNCAAMTYDLAFDPEFENLLTTTSHLTGHKINRFTNIHHSTDDLVKKVKALRMVAQRTGSCFQRCVGWDAMNAAYSTIYEMDKAKGTHYFDNLVEFIKMVQDNDFMVAGAMTDPKGDRSLRPSQQADPDLHVHIVERNDKGIVVRGAKAHMTGMVNSHYMLIMPTTAMREDDADYAVCCAIPVDAEGVIHIFGRQSNDDRRLNGCGIDQGNEKFALVGGEALTILNDVFVPWDRVFMAGEWEYSGMLVERFACYHRQNYGGCKGGVSDVVIGAAAAMADYNGTAKVSHIKDKIIEMVLLTETIYSSALACSYEGKPTASGAYYVDPLLANIGKQNTTRNIYEIDRLAHDIAGGFIATLPSDRDLNHPVLGEYVRKYFRGVASETTEDRIRMARLLENMTSGTALVESMHGACSPQAQRVQFTRQGNVEQKKKLAKKLAGIEVKED